MSRPPGGRSGTPRGLPRIGYRVGDFATFRRALLLHRAGETELAGWQPTAGSDLGLQLLDWWAYIADVLTFYNERIANEDYLGTASLDASVRHLVGLLGYRPRPGIGARGTLAAIASGPAPLRDPGRLRGRVQGQPRRCDVPDVRDHRGGDVRSADQRPRPGTGRPRHRGPGRRAARLGPAGHRRGRAARPADRPRRGAAEGHADLDRGRRRAAAHHDRLGEGHRPRRPCDRHRHDPREGPARPPQHPGAAVRHRPDPRLGEGRRLPAAARDPHRAPGQPPRRRHRHRPDTARAGRAGPVPHRG